MYYNWGNKLGKRGHVLYFSALVQIFVAMGAPEIRAGVLDDVKSRGHVICGVNQGLLGFGSKDVAGKWQGFDVDFCKAVSAAIFNDPEKVKFVPLSAQTRFDALASGEIDLLSRNSTWTMSRDVDLGLEFVGISYYDGQGFLVPKDLGLSSSLQLENHSICVQAGTTSASNVELFFKSRNMKVEILTLDGTEAMLDNYKSAKCQAYTSDRSALAAIRLQLDKSTDHMIMPEIISKEPLGPVVRQNDENWIEIVRWVLFSLINAEEAGITSASFEVGEAEKSKEIVAETFGSLNSNKLGLSPDWASNAIRHVGNYGEIFQRNLGNNSQLALSRGFNALWSRGGILYAPPMR